MGWETWSAQVVELQIFRADQENRQKEGEGFYKLDEDSVPTIQDELMSDTTPWSTSTPWKYRNC